MMRQRVGLESFLRDLGVLEEAHRALFGRAWAAVQAGSAGAEAERSFLFYEHKNEDSAVDKKGALHQAKEQKKTKRATKEEEEYEAEEATEAKSEKEEEDGEWSDILIKKKKDDELEAQGEEE